MSGCHKGSWVRVLTLLFCLSSFPLIFAQVDPQETTPSQAIAVTYPEGPVFKASLEGTSRLPGAHGTAKIRRQKGVTKLAVQLENLKPATFYGGDINTFVLWAVSPQGQFDNLGEFVVKDHESRLQASTPLHAFALFVCAEPHLMVTAPSRFRVLETGLVRDDKGFLGFFKGDKNSQLDTVEVDLSAALKTYGIERKTLASMPLAKGEVRSELEQARAALRLAGTAGAEQYAAQELEEARRFYSRAAELWESGGRDNRRKAISFAHEAVRQAVKAETQSVAAAQQAALEEERRQHKVEVEEAIAAGERALTEERRARAEERRKLHAALEKAVGKVIHIQETAEGLVIQLPELLFATEKAQLNPESREILSRLTGILQVVEGFRLRIEGHTDSTGSEEYNQRLSLQRARAVRDYLVSNGLSEAIAQAFGRGEAHPIADNTTRLGRAKNRRVEILVEETEKFSVDPSTIDVGR